MDFIWGIFRWFFATTRFELLVESNFIIHVRLDNVFVSLNILRKEYCTSWTFRKSTIFCENIPQLCISLKSNYPTSYSTAMLLYNLWKECLWIEGSDRGEGKNIFTRFDTHFPGYINVVCACSEILITVISFIALKTRSTAVHSTRMKICNGYWLTLHLHKEINIVITLLFFSKNIFEKLP